MKFDEIMKGLHLLAHSQGFYGRLLEAIYSLDEDQYSEFKQEMEDQNFQNMVDVIFYFEC